jgi:hypothetical protein
MRESVERESGGSRFPGSKRKPHGYIHNVDQASISFFVTNFPEDSNVEDLWRVFSRFGRLGDVYIPKKVDKWGKRFAFVKFMEDRELLELNQKMDDVWIGSFKLRINKSRFGRNESQEKKEPVSRSIAVELGEGNLNQDRSFRAALMNPNSSSEGSEGKQEEGNEVFEVVVEGLVLKELQESFVGWLAVNVKVCRIRTCLFMEGLAHISVTDMGRKMVLIHSPKKGEVEALWKARADWISYYFREVRAWTPSCYADRRDTWVKIYGIPLHVWGENLFKVIGAKYREFLDFDSTTASRAKLDIASIKIATSFNGCIDDSIKIKALGVIYSLRVVEEKVIEQGFHQGERLEEEEYSWVDSVKFPAEARVVEGILRGGSVEEEEEVCGVKKLMGNDNVHGDVLHDGDVSLDKGDRSQNHISVSGGAVLEQNGKLIKKDILGGSFVAEEVVNRGSQGEKASFGDRDGENEGHACHTMLKCQTEVRVDIGGGPGEKCDLAIEEVIRSATEPGQSLNKIRSKSLSPIRATGPSSQVGRDKQDGSDFSDSISLIEVRNGGANMNQISENNSSQETVQQVVSRRGRSRRPKNKSNFPNLANPGVPKFIQLAEAVKGGGGRQKKKKRGGCNTPFFENQKGH